MLNNNSHSRLGNEENEELPGKQEKADTALKDSEKRYRRLFESSREGILILNAETGRVVDVNPFLLDLLGYSYNELFGQYLWEIEPFLDLAASKTAFNSLQGTEYTRYDNLPLKTRSGKSVEVEFVSNVFILDHHKVIQCNIRDVKVRKQGERALRESEAKIPAKRPMGHGETILIVDDDDAILNLSKILLKKLGYAVLTAGTPLEAIALTKTHIDKIRLVLSDVVMPEMNGGKLVQKLMSIKPGLKYIFMSGYTADVIATRGVLDETISFIQKPFTINDLAVQVSKTLGQEYANL